MSMKNQNTCKFLLKTLDMKIYGLKVETSDIYRDFENVQIIITSMYLLNI